MSSQQIPGMSLAIWRDGEIESRGYGFADLENFVPARAGTLFRTASIAKPMTAVAALQLFEQGKLDLDAPIQKYVPAFPAKPWPVTARLLMGHLGGIRHYLPDNSDFYSTRYYTSLAETLGVFANDPLTSEPGTKYTYTTYGYVLLGAAVEGASGMTYLDYMRRNIWNPAEMTSTGPDDHHQIIAGRSRWYSKRGSAIANSPPTDTSVKIPGGGLLSTSADLIRFARAVHKGVLLKPATVKLMWTPLSTRDGKSTGYGLGWGVNQLSGRLQVSHTGGQAGTSSVLRLLPEQQVAVAMMFNLDGVSYNSLADSILELLLT
jgi:serine beta-lactamase-like protein LACTB, mitochondrial